MDSINISRLKVYGYHGVYDFEKEKGQYFYISIAAFLDVQKAAVTDELEDTVSYADICSEVSEYVQKECFDLIETVAEKVSILLLNRHSQIKEIMVTVSKPDAPVEQETEDLSVTVCRKRHTAFIAFGSNLGDREMLIEDALSAIEASDYCHIVNKSSIIATKPYGGVEQADFLNGVVEIQTYLEPENLLALLNKIEALGGRVRDIHWGPRTIDLDIILYDDLVMNTKKLTIPHVDMQNRQFVLEPLAEIAGYKMHPVFHKTITQLLNEL